MEIDGVLEEWLAGFFGVLALLFACGVPLKVLMQCCRRSTHPGVSTNGKSSTTPTPQSAPEASPSVSPANAQAAPTQAADVNKTQDSSKKTAKPNSAANKPTSKKSVRSQMSKKSMSKNLEAPPDKNEKQEGKGEGEGEGDGDKEEKNDDSLAKRKPKVYVSKRTEEIQNKGKVGRERDDYKTFKNNLPVSDFDASLKLPEFK